MPRIELELRVRVRGALSVGGLASGETLADRQVVRDGAGRLLLPGGPQVKGRMRHACEQVARTLGRPVCQAPRAAAMCPHDAAVPAPPCVVCALFGAPGPAQPAALGRPALPRRAAGRRRRRGAPARRSTGGGGAEPAPRDGRRRPVFLQRDLAAAAGAGPSSSRTRAPFAATCPTPRRSSSSSPAAAC